MPDMEGFDVLARIREFSDVAVMRMVSVRGTEEVKVKCLGKWQG